jgi:decaprenylphospho-beta-D-ribofuranose 2-oxidase
MASPATTDRVLTGWGRTAPTRAAVRRVGSVDEVCAALAAPGPRGVLARGLGRSYGDAAQNAGGLVLDTRALDALGAVDPASGTLTAQGGASIAKLTRALLPHGWFVPVTPGTAHVTLGGAIACDVHGKNHHRDSSLGAHVDRIELVVPGGAVVAAAPGEPLFDATVGGLGLTGVIVSATLRLHRVESAWIAVDTERTPDVEGAMRAMRDGDHRYRHSVAWVDLATHRRRGRAVLQRGDHAPSAAVPAGAPLRLAPRQPLRAPFDLPSGALRPATIRAWNALWFRSAGRHGRGELVPLDRFFYPLDRVAAWNRLYGRAGLVQYQLAVPDGQEEALLRIVHALAADGCPVPLAVLKRFGPASAGMLSFPLPGWTLAADLPAGWEGLGPLLRSLDERVVAAGGRVYLAKDGRLRPDVVRAMYPRLAEWQAARGAVDPDGVMRSDLARRLGVV